MRGIHQVHGKSEFVQGFAGGYELPLVVFLACNQALQCMSTGQGVKAAAARHRVSKLSCTVHP